MKTRIVINNTQLESVEMYEGERIETKMARIMDNKEPLDDGAPVIYTERKDGVLPDYNIRTDRWDIAIEATEKIAKEKIAKRSGMATLDEDKKPEMDMPKIENSPSEN